MSSSRISILLVEDNHADVELTMRALRESSMERDVAVLRDGAAALDFFFCRGAHEDRLFSQPPGLVLLDLKLPKVSGLEVLRELKSDLRTRAIPVVLLTASAESRDVAEGYRLGANSYVTKPLAFNEFRSTISSLGLYWFDINTAPPPEAFRDPIDG